MKGISRSQFLALAQTHFAPDDMQTALVGSGLSMEEAFELLSAPLKKGKSGDQPSGGFRFTSHSTQGDFDMSKLYYK